MTGRRESYSTLHHDVTLEVMRRLDAAAAHNGTSDPQRLASLYALDLARLAEHRPIDGFCEGPHGLAADDVPDPCPEVRRMAHAYGIVQRTRQRYIQLDPAGRLTVRGHHVADCPDPCPIHRPTSHHMVTWPPIRRAGADYIERVCPHDLPHPDPDDHHIRAAYQQPRHACDGCCRPPRRETP